MRTHYSDKTTISVTDNHQQIHFRASKRAQRSYASKAKRALYLKVVSLLILISTLITSLPYSTLPAFSENKDNPAYITRGGEKIDSLHITSDEKAILSAECNAEENVSYRWQIRDLTSEDRWIDINGAFMQKITVSYSLIGSMTNDKGEGYIRCLMKSENSQYLTDPLCVSISENVIEDSYPTVLVQNNSSVSLYNDQNATNDPGEYTTCSIVINYFFDNNAIAFEPYGATIAYGEPFKNIKVESPDIVGYAPFRRSGDDYIEADVVYLDYDHVYEDITINVIYEPKMVEFQVHHHLQNLHDDEYSLTADSITKGYALTGSVVPDGLAYTEEQLPGFKSFPYEKLTVAADGSTVIEIRYDRNYYLVDFDMNGGYGSEPVYTKYGEVVGANTPIRHGYVFDGWELVSYGGHTPTAEQQSKYTLSAGGTINVPDANLRYRARWITQQTSYTMVFWRENADDSGYTYWGYLEDLGAMSGSFVSGQDLISNVEGIDDEQYYTFNSEKTDKNILVEGDGSTVVNVYYTRNYYALTIKAPGLCTISEDHSHTELCYDVICDLGHTHTNDCSATLVCKVSEHTEHTSQCIICAKTEHVHGSEDCACNLDEHTHSKSCYGADVGNQASTPNGAPASPSDGFIYRRYSYYGTKYIYIKGTWYVYNGRASSGSTVDTSCGFATEHSHGTECACVVEAHTHTDTCYGDTLHEHMESCYSYSCGEITHIHSDACLRLKCEIVENHTHSSTCKNSSSQNTVKTIYKKYGESLEDIWPITDENGAVYNSGERWSPSNSSYYSQVLVHISVMPPDDFTLTLNEANYSTYTMQYYLEILPDNIPSDAEIVTYGSKQYALYNTIKANYNYVTRAEDFFDIHGFYQHASSPAFSNNQIKISSGDRTVKFYYNRITDHYLKFNNNGSIIDDKTEHGIMYGANIKDYYFVPDYPSNLEPNAYTFGGWYTSDGCFAGTEVDWDTITMPEGDLLLYSKWEPIKHSVDIYLDATLSEKIGNTQLVDHNAFAITPTDEIKNENYVFQGWFYKDVNGEEKAFIFSGIPVKDDMTIYAKWSSRVSVEYRIEYRLFSTGEQIADPTVGNAIAGNNKTFDAKAGEQLYEGYRTGFYPLTNSHTITMSAEKELHTFTFEYVYVESMPYIVRYVDQATGNKLLEDKVVSNNTLSVVTETFVKVNKMMPDTYQKRLVLSANGKDSDGDGIYDSNVITFFYNSDDKHAYYKVVHYIQNIAADGYREYRSSEAVGNIGEEYTIESITLSGFYFNGALTKINGVSSPTLDTSVTSTLGDDGMLIELYYERLSYGYTVKYTDAASSLPIMEDKTGSALFGAQVVEYAPELASLGYKLQSNNVMMRTISANEELNVIEFLYVESTVSIKYEIVGPVGCGTLTQTSENVKSITGVPNGSSPTASTGFKFVGWYTNIDCTVPIDETMVDLATNQLKPSKANSEIWQNNVTYYAKFIAKDTSLVITNSGWNINDKAQSFLYRLCGIQGTESEGVDLTFSICGNGTITVNKLPVGTYTITQISDWSWRYESADQSAKEITLSVDASQNVVVFNYNRVEDKWLDGNANEINIFN